MTAKTLPDPLVPPGIDLKNFDYLPLQVRRLRDSDLANLSSGEEFKAAVLLWCAAWHQIPASSLPNNDRALAKFCGIAPSDWPALKQGALRGFVECSDGRLYHPVLAESALTSWKAKLKRQDQTKNATSTRQKKAFQKSVGSDEAAEIQRNDERNVPRHDQRNETRNVERNDNVTNDVTLTYPQRDVARNDFRNVHQVEVEALKATTEGIDRGGAGGDATAAPGTSSTAARLPAKRLRPPGQDQPSAGFDPAAIPLPNFIPRELWRQWCEDRKKRKKPITEEAARLQLERLTGWHNAGLDATASIRNSIEAGYQGLFEPKGPRPNGAHGTPPDPTPRRELSLEEKLERDGM